MTPFAAKSTRRSILTLVAVVAMATPLTFSVPVGYATTSTSVSADDVSGSTFHPSAPVRVLDTRTGNGAPKAPVGAQKTLTVALPSAAVPSTATAVVVNVTVTQPTAPGHLTIYPGGTAQPNTS